jgi:tRNA(fMet)-specific endonuclease VapC
MTRYLIDTNHLSEAINKVSHIRDRLIGSARKGNKFGTCIPALCELEAGIQQIPRAASSRHRLDTLLEHVRLWPLDRTVAEAYGSLHLTLAKRGRALSFVDVVLAALALNMKGVLLTSDRDFEALPELQTENWLT